MGENMKLLNISKCIFALFFAVGYSANRYELGSNRVDSDLPKAFTQYLSELIKLHRKKHENLQKRSVVPWAPLSMEELQAAIDNLVMDYEGAEFIPQYQ